MAKPHTVNHISVTGSDRTQKEKATETEQWICRDIKRAYHDAGIPLPQCQIERCKRAGVEVER